MNNLLIRVYYDDTDAMGVVHHSTYLKFFERGRTESLRNRGINLVSLLSTHDVQFAVHSLSLDFIQPAKLDDLLYLITEVESIKPASILYHQRLFLEHEKGVLLCRAKIRLACLNKTFRPRGLPQDLLREILK